MNYNFTDRTRKVLAMAREEAVRLKHDYVGTEHILLGLIREGEGVAAAVLHVAGIDTKELRNRIDESVRVGRGTVAYGELPYTSRSKKTLEHSLAAARDLKHPYVGTEHLLIGLAREQKSIAAQILLGFGLTQDRAETLVIKVLSRDVGEPPVSGYDIRIDDASELSIYEQIVAQVQEGVATGKLPPGARLPAVRQLADELNIAPGTVARAYSELERLGVVVTEGARGTRIAERARPTPAHADLPETLAGLLRPVAVAAFHLGANADDLRRALERAMQGIFDETKPAP